jgi:hypothetical protein
MCLFRVFKVFKWSSVFYPSNTYIWLPGLGNINMYVNSQQGKLYKNEHV